jgi:hypothetical protein
MGQVMVDIMAEPTFETLGGKLFKKNIYNKLRGNTKKIKNLELKF